MDLPAYQTGHLPLGDDAVVPYVLMGKGPPSMVVVPGAADGLLTCVDVAVYLAWFYRERIKNCRLLILSRRDPLPEGFGVERHADDMLRAMDVLGFGPAVLECISAAGPVGQRMAIKRPDLVRGLILASTYAHSSPKTQRVLRQWISISEQGGSDVLWSTIEKKYRPPPEIVAQLDPAVIPQQAREPERLQRILRELLDLDQREILPKIGCPTLVIGGADDRTVPADVHCEMAAAIPHCRLELCPGYGHFNDMENPDYPRLVQEFVAEVFSLG
jgi:pimeloyl-ACP methyl ester carboxylesterase